ncbi:MAG: xanthine dehydrogenase molybdopterin binding subunit [Bacteroidales bacterium]|nr:xanthine dehydrogenase molybdopterin binding subunit [Bacteroidales bacterium]
MLKHESAILHVTGEAVFVGDMAVHMPVQYGHIVYSPWPHARIRKVDISAAQGMQGVSAVLTWKDIPGTNQLGPVIHDEPCLAQEEVMFIGQAVCLVAARDKDTARKAAASIRIDYEPLDFIPDVEISIEKDFPIQMPRMILKGDPDRVLKQSDHMLEGSLSTGGQEHWYLETQSALAVPGEGTGMKIYSSTQHPSETQGIVAEVLGLSRNELVVEVRRMGGAFGGKETQANHTAAWAALLAWAVRQPVILQLTREEDQTITGKRQRFLTRYSVGFNVSGELQALDVELNSDAGAATDLSMAILERAMFHVDNAYYIPHVRVRGTAWMTNKPPNTAFRGFGAPQGMAVIENIIDRIARYLGKDPIEIRKINFYNKPPRHLTHYDQAFELNRLETIFNRLTRTASYRMRRRDINRFNRDHEFCKRGMALTPVKFGISFTTSFLNQAGALVNIYRDGTVFISHGGTEMGQGLHTKIIRIASVELGIDPEHIRIGPTSTAFVPNTSATAASSGTDLNGMAVKNAIDKLKQRLSVYAATLFSASHQKPSEAKHIVFRNGQVSDSKDTRRSIPFHQLIPLACREQISLSATGFYRTPDIHFDKIKGKGKPFHYFALGMAVSEVEVDILTGAVRLLRTDILHDAGKSINVSLDLGQIRGGFIQGLGWVIMEELKYDRQGRLLNCSPDTYKIPTIGDMPGEFRVELLKDAPNPNTIRQSKAVGEPPFMLALSVWLAVKDAVSATGNHRFEPELNIPATHEAVLLAIEDIKQKNRR